ncbi:MAG TPA: hypothetical protein VGO04_07585 [Ensifer sp.]|jgi:hypothetical protein|uniref:hypothetical protein n=1 Tax=Ensifer sp. TaxID=1872086 RepID=UPI002E14F56D|nr:hypothetical protein [Ensifer sp.]
MFGGVTAKRRQFSPCLNGWNSDCTTAEGEGRANETPVAIEEALHPMSNEQKVAINTGVSQGIGAAMIKA